MKDRGISQLFLFDKFYFSFFSRKKNQLVQSPLFNSEFARLGVISLRIFKTLDVDMFSVLYQERCIKAYYQITSMLPSSTSSMMGTSKLLSGKLQAYHVRHPNLVALMGCCVMEDECFLVYEFCPNGNLSEWLFGMGCVNGLVNISLSVLLDLT